MVQHANKNPTKIPKRPSQTGQAIFALCEAMHWLYTSGPSKSLDGRQYKLKTQTPVSFEI
jgi:hypothetical protein